MAARVTLRARNSILSLGLGGHRLLVPAWRIIGHYPADAATRVRNVAVLAGNDVDVGVLHGLPGGSASDEAIPDIAGHVSKQILKHYSNIRMEAKRPTQHLEYHTQHVFQ